MFSMFFSKKFYRFKKVFLTCALSFGAVMLCTSGCVPKEEWVFKCGNAKISSGLYVNLLIDNLLKVQSKISASTGGNKKPGFDDKALYDARIGGTPALDWVDKRAKKQGEQLLMLLWRFDQLGGEKDEAYFRYLSDIYRDYDLNIDDINYKFNGDATGLNKQAFIDNDSCSAKVRTVYLEEYGKGKPRYISKEKVDEFVKQNFVKFKAVMIPKEVGYPGYCEANDPKPGSKLEKKAGVKTPKELAEKYMKQIKDGGSIDDVIKSHMELISGNKPSEPKFNTMCRFNDEDSIETVDPTQKKLILELKSDEGAVLKEDTNFYYVLQRFDLADEDIKNNFKKGYKIYANQEKDRYCEELRQKNKGKIEVNEKALAKYTSKAQAKIMGKHVRKRYDGSEFID